MNKLMNTLYSIGSFKMEIINNGGVDNFSESQKSNKTTIWSELPRSLIHQYNQWQEIENYYQILT